MLTRLMVTPTARSALITGKAFAVGVRSIAQAIVIAVLFALLGVSFHANALGLVAVAAVIVLEVGVLLVNGCRDHGGVDVIP